MLCIHPSVCLCNCVDLVCDKLTEFHSKEAVSKALRTSICSMQYGNEEFLADLVAEACSKLRTKKLRPIRLGLVWSFLFFSFPSLVFHMNF